VKGSGERFRDFVYIDDVVDAFLLSEKNCTAKTSKIYNVASSAKTLVSEITDAIVSNLGTAIGVKFEGATPGDQFGIYGDATLIEKDLGWKSVVRFDDGMKKMIEWAKEVV
jgi:UDP-glucose 4-epimerase